MTAHPPPLLNLEFCRQNEAECIRQSVAEGTSPSYRTHLIGLAENWARLIKAAEDQQ